MEAATGGCDVFGFGAGVFPTVEGANEIDYAQCLALGVETKPGADIGQLAAGAAAYTLTATAF